jgi:hypothetical protein
MRSFKNSFFTGGKDGGSSLCKPHRVSCGPQNGVFGTALINLMKEI